MILRNLIILILFLSIKLHLELNANQLVNNDLNKEERKTEENNESEKLQILTDLNESEIKWDLSQFKFILEKLELKNLTVEMDFNGFESDEVVDFAIRNFDKFV